MKTDGGGEKNICKSERSCKRLVAASAGSSNKASVVNTDWMKMFFGYKTLTEVAWRITMHIYVEKYRIYNCIHNSYCDSAVKASLSMSDEKKQIGKGCCWWWWWYCLWRSCLMKKKFIKFIILNFWLHSAGDLPEIKETCHNQPFVMLQLSLRCLYSSQTRSGRVFLWLAANKGVKYDVQSMFLL